MAGRGKNLQEKENKAMYEACHLRGNQQEGEGRGQVEEHRPQKPLNLK
jgi:hypothetical protein